MIYKKNCHFYNEKQNPLHKEYIEALKIQWLKLLSSTLFNQNHHENYEIKCSFFK